MDVGGGSLPGSVNPKHFPAKLWRLVNNPAYKAICWDSFGESVIIDQQLFERQILSQSTITSDNADAFRTTNFSSFVRQLNLYGFRRPDPVINDNPGDFGMCHYFHNPNFKRNHPELIANLKRLTVENKAKLRAGLNVNGQPPSRFQLCDGADDGRSSLLGPTHQESTHPVSLSHHYAGAASSSNAVHIQQGLLAHANHGNPNFISFNPPNGQYQPGYYPPDCQSYHPNLVASQMAGSGLQTGVFSAYSYYQASYPVNMFCHGDHNQDLQCKENQEVEKRDINMDTIFQMADELMQTLPNSFLVNVLTPENLGPVLAPSSSTCDRVLCDGPAAST